MGSTGTRPPLFDPEPGGFDDDVATEPRFPRRPKPSRSTSGGRSGGDSPRWVRPFIFGGLVLVALISLLSVFGRDVQTVDEDPTTAPVVVDVPPPVETDDPPAESEVTAEPATQATTPAAPPAGAAAATAGAAAATPVAASPSLQRATAFAVQFAHDYLNYDQANPEVRQRELRVYLAPGVDPQLGWNGQGSQVAVLTVPVETRETDEGVVVTVAAQVTGRDAPRWVHVAVRLLRDEQGRLAVTQPPAFVPRPQPGSPTSPAARAIDQVLSDQLQGAMQPLFSAFAADSSLDVPGVTAPGAGIRGLAGQVSLATVGPLRVFVGDDEVREASVEVSWTDDVTGGTTTQSYALVLTSADGPWLVTEVAAA